MFNFAKKAVKWYCTTTADVYYTDTENNHNRH